MSIKDDKNIKRVNVKERYGVTHICGVVLCC